jgi:hypothetical protein
MNTSYILLLHFQKFIKINKIIVRIIKNEKEPYIVLYRKPDVTGIILCFHFILVGNLSKI